MMKHENILDHLMKIGPNKYISKRDPDKYHKMYRNGIRTPLVLLEMCKEYYRKGDYKRALYFKKEALLIDKDRMFADQINAIPIPMEMKKKKPNNGKWWKGPLFLLPWLLVLLLLGMNIKTYRHIIKAKSLNHTIIYDTTQQNPSPISKTQEVIMDEPIDYLEIPHMAEKLIAKDPSKEYYFMIKEGNELEPLAWAKKTSNGIVTEINNPTILKDQRANTNLLRNALKIYKDEKGQYPLDLGGLVDEGYLDRIPEEPFSNSSSEKEKMDYSGGWTYDPKLLGLQSYGSDREELDALLKPNVAGTSDQAPGYEPISMEVDLVDQKIKVFYGMEVKAEYPISSGKDTAKTPMGEFKIIKKYKLSTQQQNQSMFKPYGPGIMELSISDYAIHGTDEPQKIGSPVSNGCIRMTNEDFNDLYDGIPKGIMVKINGPKGKQEIVYKK